MTSISAARVSVWFAIAAYDARMFSRSLSLGCSCVKNSCRTGARPKSVRVSLVKDRTCRQMSSVSDGVRTGETFSPRLFPPFSM